MVETSPDVLQIEGRTYLIEFLCCEKTKGVKRRGIVLFEEEAKKAIQERRRAQSVKVQPRAIFSISEVCGYICFVLALLALCAYMFLRLL